MMNLRFFIGLKLIVDDEASGDKVQQGISGSTNHVGNGSGFRMNSKNHMISRWPGNLAWGIFSR